MELIENYLDFKKELEEFEDSFEHNEIVDIWNVRNFFFFLIPHFGVTFSIKKKNYRSEIR